MVLNSKEEFMDLYLAIRAKSGYLTFTQKYPDDFLPWISSGKYHHLFSFFHSKSDLDFLRDHFSIYQEIIECFVLEGISKTMNKFN